MKLELNLSYEEIDLLKHALQVYFPAGVENIKTSVELRVLDAIITAQRKEIDRLNSTIQG